MNNNKNTNGIAVIAGISLLIMAFIAPIANFGIIQRLIVSNDATLTVKNIFLSEGLFRQAICLFLIVVLLDVIVAWALYIFLTPINKNLSLLMAWVRIIYATMLSVSLFYLINVLQFLKNENYLKVFTQEQLQAQIMLCLEMFNKSWEFGLILFGIHLLLLGYIIFKAGYMKKILGILILLAGTGYSLDGLSKMLILNSDISISSFTFIGEVVLIFWLLIKGRTIIEK